MGSLRGRGGATGYLTGYSHTIIVISLASCIPLTGLILPIIEELYFRGFLLPRISRLGRWAPVINTTLFSLYHFWWPQGILSRVMLFLPATWIVWRKKDLRVSIGAHAGTTFLQTTVGVIALWLGVLSL